MKTNIWIMNHYAGGMFFDKGGRHYWFAKYLEKNGYKPVVFCANSKHGSKPEKYFDDNFLWHEHLAEEINTPFVFVRARTYVGNGKNRVLNMLDFYFNVKKAAKEYAKLHGKPDVIYASSAHPLTTIAGIQLARYFGVKCICEVRDLWPEAIFQFTKITEKSLLGRALVAGEHWIYRNANAIVFTKEGDTDYLKEKRWTTAQNGDISLDKCHYINNGVDVGAYEECINTKLVNDTDLNDETKFNVTYVGAIRLVNNVGNLLDAAKLISIHGGYYDVQFLIYGDGNQVRELKERVLTEHLDNVKMKGCVNKQYIPYILSKSSVNILNYAQNKYNWTRGNSSNKLFEYMASGKPIISTVRMGYSIINRYGCGVELEEDTPEKLAEQIMRFHDMKEDDRNRIGDNAKKGANDFEISVLTKKLVDVIENLDM